MKKNFTILFTFLGLFLLGMTSQVSAQTIILSEDFASLTVGGHASTTGATGPSSSALATGTEDFPGVDRAYSAGGAVKFGTGSAAGSITSKPLDLSVNGGEFKVKMKVKGWSTIEGVINVTLGDDTQTATYTATINDSFEEVEVSFTGGQANSTIKIGTSARRAFLDEVTIYYGGSAANNDATLSEIFIDDLSFDDFDPAAVSYFVTLPATATLPVITATTTDPNATKEITNISSLPDYAYVDVTAENGTTVRQYKIHFSKEAADGEKGSKSNPYTITEAAAAQLPTGCTTHYWVKGYIVGSMSSSTLATEAPFVVSNIAIAAVAGETNIELVMPVELPNGSESRTAINLQDNPTNLGKEIAVYGTLETYFSRAGIKATSDYELNTTTGITENEIGEAFVTSANGELIVTATAGEVINVYDVVGKTIATVNAVEGQNIIPMQANQFVVVKAGNKVSKVIIK